MINMNIIFIFFAKSVKNHDVNVRKLVFNVIVIYHVITLKYESVV